MNEQQIMNREFLLRGIKMKFEEHAKECNDALEKLVDKKILDVKFKPYNNDCWRLYIKTDKGEMVMSFCRDWTCPEVEYRN